MVSLYILSTEDGGNVDLFSLFSTISGSKELQYRAIIIHITVSTIVTKTYIHVCNITPI